MEFYTVQKRAEKEIIIKKSRFIAYVSPTETEEEAEKFIEEIKKKHRDATHNVPAYIIGKNKEIKRASDDGEPSGTAGKPILDVLDNKDLTNVTVVVTRYFGGIKLGTGGLIRAYANSAVEGIKEAGEIVKKLHQIVGVEVDYSLYGTLERTIENLELPLGDIEYTDKVTLNVKVPISDVESFIKRVIDLTNGSAKIDKKEKIYLSFKRDN